MTGVNKPQLRLVLPNSAGKPTTEPRYVRTFFPIQYGLLLLVLLASPGAGAGDWPQWRADAARSATVPDPLPGALTLRWQREYGPREPVWDDPLNWDLMRYDRVLEPVVAGKRLFLGFNDSDKVVALDTDSGKELWRFYTDGPVRLPPAVAGDAVFAVSDDGYLYCLDAGTGALRWRFRGGPSERKVLGNKRLISSWPARGGVVARDGIVYFGASIWPMMGTFLYALEAETGEVRWVNDGTGAYYMDQPHNSPSFAGVAPQGALVAVDSKLLVPGGRSVPACFDVRTGDFLYYRLAENNKTGGSFVCGAGDVFFAHHREGLTTMYNLADGESIIGEIGVFPVVTPETYYFSGTIIRAYDVAKLHAGRENWQTSLRWELAVDASGDLILAGDRLYAAGGPMIAALDLKADGAPTLAWRKRVPGSVERLVAADDKLFAVTLEGMIYAFGVTDELSPTPTYLLPRPTTRAKAGHPDLDSVLGLGVREGYALFHGAGDGALLQALTENTDLHIIATDADPKRVETLRRHFDALGYYGKRVAVHVGTPETFPAPPYLASLTVVHGGPFPRDAAMIARIFESMRPYGGMAWVRPSDGAKPGALAALLGTAGRLPARASRDLGHTLADKLPVAPDGASLSHEAALLAPPLKGAQVLSDNGVWRFTRSGPLEGAGTWTHTYGNIANTTKSDDQLVKLPLGVLWFGGSSNMDVLPRHGHGPPEQVAGGRLFIQGLDGMSARDVYTGRVLWKTRLDRLDTFGTYYNETYANTPTSTQYNQVHLPGANVRGSNFVVAPDKLYIVEGGGCSVLDTVTGARLGTFYLPRFEAENGSGPLPPEWGYIGVYDGVLLGGNQFVPYSTMDGAKTLKPTVWNDYDESASREMVALDRHTGEVRWRLRAEHGFLHNGTAVGNGVIYLLDKLPLDIEQRLLRRGTMPPDSYRLLALDVYSGRPLWRKQRDVFGSFLSYSEECDILLQCTRPSRDMVEGEDGTRMIAYDGKTGAILWDQPNTYDSVPILHGEDIICQGSMYSLRTGEALTRRNPLTGLDDPWTFERNYGCSYPIASEYLLTFRSAAAGFFDLASDGGTGNLGGFKSGCTSNLVVADGVLNAPDYTRTCSCAYQNQTSLAMVHMPEGEVWTFNVFTSEEAVYPLKRLGVNFGAPGDRMADNGTLWLEYPIVGGPSPEIPIEVTGLNDVEPRVFRHHASQFGGDGPNWVMASGMEGAEDIRLKLVDGGTPRPYTVRLYLAEPNTPGTEPRLVTIELQGQEVVSALDIAQAAGGSRRGIVREFRGVYVADTLDLRLTVEEGSNPAGTVLCGIEVVAEDG